MTEELNNFNTDLKDLFMQNKLEEIGDLLSEKSTEEIKELTLYNHEVIQKYFNEQKYAILLQHMPFVAYCCFLCEVAAKNQIITEEEANQILPLYQQIYDMRTEQV